MTARPLGPPSHLGKYEVGAKIGGGGMARVYIGRASEGAGAEQLVALKVIRDELANDERFTTMFVDEAKILARLSHPNIIHTLEYGVTGDHRFIAMELLSGRTYADVWDVLASRGERMPLRVGAWLCARVAAGLHSAHETVDETGAPLNVIHRDVNPGNIFLTHGGEVKLIDFGLAKARVRASHSVDGIVKGKIPYLAPEQAHGKPIDRRIDVYALGTTLWEAATMKRLFKKDSDVATIMAIRDALVPDARELNAELPEALWAIIEKATQRDPDARYQTAEELEAALDAFVGDAALVPGELAALLARLFPGEEERHASWARAATSVRVPKHTMAPPAPVPTASSTMFDDADAPPSDPSVPDVKADTNADGEADAEAEAQGDAEPPPERSRERSSRPPRPDARRRAVEPHALDRAEDPAGARRFWVSLAIVVAVLAGLVALFGAR